MPPPESFVVEDLSEAHGFARLRAESGAGLFHCGLFPELSGGELSPLRLQRGDRVEGVRRGQTVSQVRWLSLAAPPDALVRRMEALLGRLGEWGLHAEQTPEALADHQWREGPGSPLLAALRPPLQAFFGPDAHPFEDEGLLTRVEKATAEHLPGFSVKPVAGEARFQVEPGAHVLVGGAPDWEAPTGLFEPLVEHINEALGRARAAVRWVPVRDNWVLAPPALVQLLMEHGVLQGRALA